MASVILRSKDNPNIVGPLIRWEDYVLEDGFPVRYFIIRVAKGIPLFDEPDDIWLTPNEVEVVSGTLPRMPKFERKFMGDFEEPPKGQQVHASPTQIPEVIMTDKEGYSLVLSGQRFDLWRHPQRKGREKALFRYLVEDRANRNMVVKDKMTWGNAYAMWSILERNV
jgi:hypothetical protein